MRRPSSIVSGGTGYVGRFIVEELLAAGHEVTIMGRHPPQPGYFSRPVRFEPLSLHPQGISPTIFQGADFFVHGAFDHVPGKYRGGEGRDPESFRRRNLDGTMALFAAAKRAGVRSIVFLSSRAIYGPRPAGACLDEADEGRPDTLYGEIKLAAEKALQDLCGQGCAGVSLRLTGVYGPAGPGKPHKWAGLFSDYLAGKKIDARVATEVHGRDAAAAVRLVLDRPEQKAVLNVSDIVVDRREILAIVKRESNSPHPLPPAGDPSQLNVMRTDRLRALGWAPGGRELFEETVARLVRSG